MANNLNFTFNYRIKIRAHLEKSFKRKHKRSGMYYACVRNTVLCCMNAPQTTESRSHAKHLFCMVYVSVEIGKRQSRMGIVNYVHNFQLLTLSVSATDDSLGPPNLTAYKSEYAVTLKYIHPDNIKHGNSLICICVRMLPR